MPSWIFDVVCLWSRQFRGRILGLGLGRVHLAFHPGRNSCIIYKYMSILKGKGKKERGDKKQA